MNLDSMPIMHKCKEILTSLTDLKQNVQDINIVYESTSQEMLEYICNIDNTVKNDTEIYCRSYMSNKSFVASSNLQVVALDENYVYCTQESSIVHIYDKYNYTLIASIPKQEVSFRSLIVQNDDYICFSGTYYSSGGSTYYGFSVISKETLSLIYTCSTYSTTSGTTFYDVIKNPYNNDELYFLTYNANGKHYHICKGVISTNTYTSLYNDYMSSTTTGNADGMIQNCTDALVDIVENYIVFYCKNGIYKFHMNNTSKTPVFNTKEIAYNNKKSILKLDNMIIVARNNSIIVYDDNYNYIKKIIINENLVNKSSTNTELIYSDNNIIFRCSSCCIVLDKTLEHIIRYHNGDDFDLCDNMYIYKYKCDTFELTDLKECNVTLEGR